MRLQFSNAALDDLNALDSPTRRRIVRKLEWFIRADDPLVFAALLSETSLGDYRFRIGD